MRPWLLASTFAGGLLASTLAGGLVGCTKVEQIAGALGELDALNKAVNERFACEGVQSEVGHDRIVMMLVKPRALRWPRYAQRKLLRKVAAFVRDNYDGYTRVSAVCIGIMEVTQEGCAKVTRRVGPFCVSRRQMERDSPSASEKKPAPG